MKINYKTQASASEILKGVNVSLTAEYEKNVKPANVTFSCEGTLQEEGNPYVNISGTYDCVNEMVSSISGTNFPSNFLPQLEAKAMEFYNQLGI
jgi:hypothetical protein